MRILMRVKTTGDRKKGTYKLAILETIIIMTLLLQNFLAAAQYIEANLHLIN